jgi:hypothetical protein
MQIKSKVEDQIQYSISENVLELILKEMLHDIRN